MLTSSFKQGITTDKSTPTTRPPLPIKKIPILSRAQYAVALQAHSGMQERVFAAKYCLAIRLSRRSVQSG
jgi:hypothetical protein